MFPLKKRKSNPVHPYNIGEGQRKLAQDMDYPGLCQSFLQARQYHSSFWLSNVSLFLPQVMLHRLTFYGNTSSQVTFSMGPLKKG